MSIDLDIIKAGAAAFGVDLDGEKLRRLAAYADAVLEANREFNLTAITDESQFAVKHIVDSLTAVKLIPLNAAVCDVGAGAGFPSVPLAIARPDIRVTALDSTAKKTEFVRRAAARLGIGNLSVRAGRAEDCADLREGFDVVCARAVAAMNVLAELCLPMAKTGGVFIAYKTDSSEADGSASALSKLGGRVERIERFSLPNGDRRALIVVTKAAPTPAEYPRPYATIKKRPL